MSAKDPSATLQLLGLWSYVYSPVFFLVILLDLTSKSHHFLKLDSFPMATEGLLLIDPTSFFSERSRLTTTAKWAVNCGEGFLGYSADINGVFSAWSSCIEPAYIILRKCGQNGMSLSRFNGFFPKAPRWDNLGILTGIRWIVPSQES